jgi:hypothetical protein
MFAIVDDLGSSICLREIARYQDKQGAKLWARRSLYADTRNLGGNATRMEQQLDRTRATIGNIYEERGNVYDPAYGSGPGERVNPAGGPV